MSVRNGVAPMLIRCGLAQGTCIGKLLLQPGAGAAGTRRWVRVKLPRAGTRLVRRHEHVKVWANVSYGGTPVRLARVTLRR